MGNDFGTPDTLLPLVGISYPSAQSDASTPQPESEPELKLKPLSPILKLELLKEYFLFLDKKHGQLLRVFTETATRKIFVRGKFSAGSQTVCLPKSSNIAQSDAIMRYYIDDFMKRLFSGDERTLLFQNNQILGNDFSVAGFLVSKATVTPAPQSDTGQPRMRRRIKPRKSPPLPEQLISHVIIADNTPAIPSAPDSFPATLFPLITDFNEKGLQVTVLAAEGQTVMLSKEGEIIERGTEAVNPQTRLAILEKYFKTPAAQPYFYYESHVDKTPAASSTRGIAADMEGFTHVVTEKSWRIFKMACHPTCPPKL